MNSRRSGRLRLLALVAALASMGIGAILLTGDDGSKPFTDPEAPSAGGRIGARPNVVVVMTDDQAVGTMDTMTQVNELLASRGATFERSYVSYPLCCPSRATFFTGQLAHNHGVLGTKAPPDPPSYRTMRERMSSETLPLWLRESGCETAHIGKWLHGYGDYAANDPAPPGWSRWNAPLGFDSYHNFTDFTLAENGERIDYEGDDNYQSDVFTNKATEFIAEHAHKPFFLSLGYVAPHVGDGGSERCTGSAQPAARHEGMFGDAELPRPPSFNEEDVSDKPERVRDLPPLTADDLETVEVRYQCQLESLQAVDEGVARIHDVLADSGILDNTIIVYTSDNGFMQGEHRFTGSKLFPYDPALRVPLIVSGPGIPRGEVIGEPVLNVDLPATILDWAGAAKEPGTVLDGRSFQPLLEGGRLADRDILFEGYFQNRQTNQRVKRLFSSILRGRSLYTEWSTGEVELYDLAADPDQLKSLDKSPAQAQRLTQLAAALADLRGCAGTGAAPAPGRAPCG